MMTQKEEQEGEKVGDPEPSARAAPGPPPDGQPLPAGTKLRQREVQVVRGPGGCLAAAWADDATPEGMAGWTCAYAVSQDRGRSWSRTIFRRHPAFAVTTNPTIAVDGRGVVFAVAMAAQQDYSGGILEVSVSEDDGRAWSSWRPIIARRNGIPDRPKLVTAPDDGSLHLVYTDVERTGTTWKPLRGAIRVICSTDHGVSWSEPRTISGRLHRTRWLIDGYQGPAITPAPGGDLLASWAGYYGNRVYFASCRANGGAGRSWHGEEGARFGRPVPVRLQAQPGRGIFTWLLGASVGTPATELAVDTTGRSIVISVHEAHAIDRIALVGSRDGGRSWSRLGSLTRSGTNAALAFDSRGHLHAIWTELRDGRVDARYAVSGDLGRGFGPSVSLAGGGARVGLPRSDEERRASEMALGSYQSLVIDGEDRAYAAWIDLRAGLTAPRLLHSIWEV
jgi:hypothetical protein